MYPARARLTWAVVVGFAAIIAMDEHAARAGEISARLDYAAESTCPTAADFEAVVAKHLGYSPFRDDVPERVVVHVEVSGRGLLGHLEWRSDDGGWAGERRFPSRTSDCGELVRAMGFALAVQFQLLATTEAPDNPPPPPPPPPPPTVIALPPPPAVSPPPAPSGPAIAAGAGASAGVGLAPDVVALGRVF